MPAEVRRRVGGPRKGTRERGNMGVGVKRRFDPAEQSHGWPEPRISSLRTRIGPPGRAVWFAAGMGPDTAAASRPAAPPRRTNPGSCSGLGCLSHLCRVRAVRPALVPPTLRSLQRSPLSRVVTGPRPPSGHTGVESCRWGWRAGWASGPRSDLHQTRAEEPGADVRCGGHQGRRAGQSGPQASRLHRPVEAGRLPPTSLGGRADGDHLAAGRR
jgi:hypothetical protein